MQFDKRWFFVDWTHSHKKSNPFQQIDCAQHSQIHLLCRTQLQIVVNNKTKIKHFCFIALLVNYTSGQSVAHTIRCVCVGLCEMLLKCDAIALQISFQMKFSRSSVHSLSVAFIGVSSMTARSVKRSCEQINWLAPNVNALRRDYCSSWFFHVFYFYFMIFIFSCTFF